MRKATRAQWVKFGIVTLLYLMFLVWVKSWWGLIVLPFIFDIYISKKIPWSFWKKPKNPAVRGIMSWGRRHCIRLGGCLFCEYLHIPELSDTFVFAGKIIAGG